jgi:hypothetical protein
MTSHIWYWLFPSTKPLQTNLTQLQIEDDITQNFVNIEEEIKKKIETKEIKPAMGRNNPCKQTNFPSSLISVTNEQLIICINNLKKVNSNEVNSSELRISKSKLELALEDFSFKNKSQLINN